jgi:hypothetical protein
MKKLLLVLLDLVGGMMDLARDPDYSNGLSQIAQIKNRSRIVSHRSHGSHRLRIVAEWSLTDHTDHTD